MGGVPSPIWLELFRFATGRATGGARSTGGGRCQVRHGPYWGPVLPCFLGPKWGATLKAPFPFVKYMCGFCA